VRLQRIGRQIGNCGQDAPQQVVGSLEEGVALLFSKCILIEEGMSQVLPGCPRSVDAQASPPLTPAVGALAKLLGTRSAADRDSNVCSPRSSRSWHKVGPAVHTTGLTAQVLVAADSWEENKKNCSLCSKLIGKRHFARRHHCRTCGKCVCSACSPHLVAVSNLHGLQRVCTACVSEPATRSEDVVAFGLVSSNASASQTPR
jgi:hypothetical protein